MDELATMLDDLRPAVLRIAQRRLGGDRHAAEDVVSDVYVRLWERALITREEYGAGYVVQAVLNRIRTGWRSDRRRDAALQRLVAVPAAPPEVEGAVADRIDAARLLAALPARERRIVGLRYLRGLSQAEVAARAGVPMGTVASSSARSLDRLRRMAS